MPSPPLLNPQTLRALWIALRRAPRDSHARKIFLRLSFSFALIAAFIGTYVYMLHGFSSEYGLGQTVLVLIPGAIVFLIVAAVTVKQRLDEQAQERDSPWVPQALKLALYREACLLAILLERLGSEAALEKEVPPGVNVITRRVLLDRLASVGLRENLDPWLLDLLLAPDGHWTAEQKRRATPAWECLAVLRWTLGIGVLRGLTINPRYNISDARSLFSIKKPTGLNVLPPWELRPARDAARVFFQRCWLELLARNQVSKAAEEDIARALEVREEIQEAGYTGDYLVGAQTVPELDTQLLWFVTLRAWNRAEVLTLLVDLTAGDAPPEKLRRFLAHYFAPADLAEKLEAPRHG
jgi:hypothetical protein